LDLVLVVGERTEQAKALAERLRLYGVEAIHCARDWDLVRRSLMAHDVAVVTVDVDRSQASARFFERLNESVAVPLVVLGNRNDPDQVIWHLDHGAADYIPRSTPHQVVADKIMSLLRMVTGDAPSIHVGDLAIDIDARVVSLAGVDISLTPIEFRLLAVLAENMGKVCSRCMLLKAVWGDGFEDCSHYLPTYVGHLRKKIEPNRGSPRMIVTKWGHGYRLVAPAGEAMPSTRSTVRTAISG
jgi:two-component system, OmpR family, KDP operon response regulator KdpE